MTIWAVLPVKRYAVGKSRLRSLFSEAEIAQLNRQLFESTFTKIREIPEIDHVLVISREDLALDWCRSHGGTALMEDSPSSLNLAVTKAQGYVSEHGGGCFLVLPSDLPLMTPQDISRLIEQMDGKRILVIVPDHLQSGTNALLMSDPELIKPCFGTDSFRKHTRQALAKNAELVVYLNQNIQWDLDTSLELNRIINNQPEISILSQLRKETSS